MAFTPDRRWTVCFCVFSCGHGVIALSFPFYVWIIKTRVESRKKEASGPLVAKFSQVSEFCYVSFLRICGTGQNGVAGEYSGFFPFHISFFFGGPRITLGVCVCRSQTDTGFPVTEFSFIARPPLPHPRPPTHADWLLRPHLFPSGWHWVFNLAAPPTVGTWWNRLLTSLCFRLF